MDWVSFLVEFVSTLGPLALDPSLLTAGALAAPGGPTQSVADRVPARERGDEFVRGDELALGMARKGPRRRDSTRALGCSV